MNALAAQYDVQHIYFIDRDHRIFNTNLSYDRGLAFPKGPFTDFLDSVFGKGRAMSDGIDLSSVTGTLRTYTYYGPPGKDYLIEVSTEVRTTLKQSDFGWMSQYFFEDYFTDAVKSNAYVTDVDMYLINASGGEPDKPAPDAGEVIQMPQIVTEEGKAALRTLKVGDQITTVFSQQTAIEVTIIR